MNTTAPALLGTHASQRCFRVFLRTLSRPGEPVALDDLEAVAAGPGALPLALADIDTAVAIVGNDEQASQICEATRSPLVPVPEAAIVALYAPTADLIGQCRRGSALAPERGAKVAIACNGFDPVLRAGPDQRGDDVGSGVAPAPGAGSVRLSLRGPGVKGSIGLSIRGVSPDVIGAVQEANRQFPEGLDTWFVSCDGNVVGVPRSNVIEVL